ncbi:MAG: TRAP transporter small permease [Casimicrobiaceae bacterium]
MMAQAAAPLRPTPLLRLERAAALVAALAVLGMMAVGTLDVLGTVLLGRPLSGAYEITESLMVAAVFLALALSQREGRQIRVTLVVERLGPRMVAVLDALAELASLGVYAVIAWYGWGVAIESHAIGEFSSGLLRFPVWPAKLALALGATLMVVQCAAGSWLALRGRAVQAR